MKKILETIKRKWAKYLLEILVILIGILGAFALNNWNESTKDRKEELKYIANLKTDLLEDLTQLEIMIEDRENKYSSSKKLLEYSDQNLIKNLNDFFYHLSAVTVWTEFTPNKSTIEELVNSGNLSLIKNDSIKNLLLKVNQLNENIVTARDHMRREYEQYLYDRLVLYIDLDSYIVLDAFKESLSLQIDSSVVKLKEGRLNEEAYEFLSDKKARNGLLFAALNNTTIVSFYVKLKDHVNKLLVEIDKELLNG